MINLSVYAFTTGLHFALLQFAYLLVLQINVSSTYLTFMAITLSWVLGAIVGLWWEKLDTEIGLNAGLLSYYGTYALLTLAPLSRVTLIVASLGVVLTGLWAGRFFMVMRPLFRRVDGIFFHENNGFLLGVILMFVGFTTFGRPFLLWAPLLSASVLVIHAHWIEDLRVKWVRPVLVCIAGGLAITSLP